MPEPTTELLTKYRRDLHQIPELDFALPKTIAYVREVLEGLPGKKEVFSPCESCVCCFFDRGSDHTTALRTDMDALPVRERTGVSFASRHPGQMHACGHDGHMAMALGIAQHIAGHLDELPRSVLIVFQPAEETTGGAKVVCETGVFERYHVDRIFGFHLWPDLPEGTIASRAGGLLAASNETDVVVRGVGSHIAKASEGRDALEAATRALMAMYAHMDERAKEEPCLLKFGNMEAGTVRNQIASEATLRGSLRTFSVDMGRRLREELPEVAAGAAGELGCTATVSFSEGYPPVVNDGRLFSLVSGELPDIETLPEPLLIAEDFAWYQQWIPGVFLLLGTGTGIPLHADTFDFDEKVLARGVEAYARLIRLP